MGGVLLLTTAAIITFHMGSGSTRHVSDFGFVI